MLKQNERTRVTNGRKNIDSGSCRMRNRHVVCMHASLYVPMTPTAAPGAPLASKSVSSSPGWFHRSRRH